MEWWKVSNPRVQWRPSICNNRHMKALMEYIYSDVSNYLIKGSCNQLVAKKFTVIFPHREPNFQQPAEWSAGVDHGRRVEFNDCPWGIAVVNFGIQKCCPVQSDLSTIELVLRTKRKRFMYCMGGGNDSWIPYPWIRPWSDSEIVTCLLIQLAPLIKPPRLSHLVMITKLLAVLLDCWKDSVAKAMQS